MKNDDLTDSHQSKILVVNVNGIIIGILSLLIPPVSLWFLANYTTEGMFFLVLCIWLSILLFSIATLFNKKTSQMGTIAGYCALAGSLIPFLLIGGLASAFRLPLCC